MLVLIDESLPKPLIRVLPGHEARTVRQMGWDGKENGDLLRLAVAAGVGALITADRNMEFQQDVARSGMAIVVLNAPTNSPEDILPLAPQIVEALATILPAQVVHVGRRRGA